MDEFSLLISTIFTPNERKNFISSLEKCEHGFFRVKLDVEKFISEQFSAKTASALSVYASLKGVDLDNPSQATEFFKNLRQEILRVPVVNLHVAFEPSRRHIQNIAAWMREESKNVFINVVRDDDVIGGCVVEFEGKRGDFSLRKKIEEAGILDVGVSN